MESAADMAAAAEKKAAIGAEWGAALKFGAAIAAVIRAGAATFVSTAVACDSAVGLIAPRRGGRDRGVGVAALSDPNPAAGAADDRRDARAGCAGPALNAGPDCHPRRDVRAQRAGVEAVELRNFPQLHHIED
jgi:hypothetical protein